MKSLLPVIFTLVFSVIYWNSIAQRNCATMQYLEQQLLEDPDMATNMAELELITQSGNWQRKNSEGGVVIVIPVVVHVVYLNNAQNLSEARILSQIAALNRDFRRTNPDTVNTLAAFKNLGADVEVEFCMAKRDPSGNYTDGITRTQTTKTSFTLNNNVKYTAQGGKDAWPTDQYLNIWVCNISANILGYAQFPGGNVATDGIVVDYEYFGASGATPPFDFGRTSTHEVGHWLNLRHIWGDGGCGADDFVSDTPLSDAANYGCPLTHVSCTTIDMVQNYMDYTDDACMNLFTLGQKQRMLATLNTTRESLITSKGCQYPELPPLADLMADKRIACGGTPVQFTDISINNVIQWEWHFPGANPSVSTIQNPVVTYPDTGLFDVMLIATNLYGSDTIIFNNYIEVIGADKQLPRFAGFETGTLPQADWNISNPSNIKMELTSSAGGFGTGRSLMFENWNADSAVLNGKAFIYSGKFDFSNIPNPYLKYDYAYSPAINNSDTLIVVYSLDCGETFDILLKKSGNSLATAPLGLQDFIPAAAQWVTDSIGLSSLTGNKIVSIGVGVISAGANNLFIDNIYLGQTPALAPVADFRNVDTTFCTPGIIYFKDNSQNIPSEWSWQFPGGNPSNSTDQNPVITYNSAGVYNVSLKVKNVIGEDSIVKVNNITVHESPQVNLLKTDVACRGNNSGSILAQVTGGTQPFTYSWNNGDSVSFAQNLYAGNYSVTVTDLQGCEVIKKDTITQPAAMIFSIKSTPENAGFQNGTATVEVIGATPPYTYLWSDGQTTSVAIELAAGSYSVTVTDANMCSMVSSVNVGLVTGYNDPVLSGKINLYPNPANDQIQLEIESEASEVNLVILNMLGQHFGRYLFNGNQMVNETIDISELPAGVYVFRIKIGEQMIDRKINVIR